MTTDQVEDSNASPTLTVAAEAEVYRDIFVQKRKKLKDTAGIIKKKLSTLKISTLMFS